MRRSQRRDHAESASQVLRYLTGAFLALGVDTVLVSLLIVWAVPLALSRLLALLAGITTTYLFNRRFTFDATHPASLHDWSRYVAAQSVGSALNYGVSTLLLHLTDRAWWQVTGSILAGAAAGFCVNFFAARRLLHRRDLRE